MLPRLAPTFTSRVWSSAARSVHLSYWTIWSFHSWPTSGTKIRIPKTDIRKIVLRSRLRFALRSFFLVLLLRMSSIACSFLRNIGKGRKTPPFLRPTSLYCRVCF